MTQTDDWSWFDAPELSDVDLTGHSVTAVLVCRNAGAWLNATLAGIGQLDRRPEQIIAVDNQSSDDTRATLDIARGAGLVDLVIEGKANASFGQAVELALASAYRPTKWVWFLHDDAIPDRHALTELLQLAARTANLAVAVPLQVRPSRRNHAARTLEVGASITGSGLRALGLEPDEVAQGQYESTPVLGGSTCGMLIEWQTLLDIGGFDRCISAYRDGLDLSWRAHLLGRWVLSCPTARMVHRQVGRSEIRTSTIASHAGRSEASWDRLMGMRLVAAHSHGIKGFLMVLRLTIVSLFSALVYTLGRVPDRAKDELQAWSDFTLRSRKPVKRLRAVIKKVSEGSTATKHRIRALRPSVFNVIDDGFQSFAQWVQTQWAPNRDQEMTLDDLLGDEFTRRIGDGRKRIPLGVWLAVLVGGILLMGRNLYSKGVITAPGLLGTPQSLLEGFQYASSAGGDPWLLIMAATSIVAIHPGWLPFMALLTSIPIIMLVASWYLRRRIEHTRLRWLAAGGYALLPVVLGGLNRGTLWIILLAIFLPFIAEWITRLPQPWMGARSLQTVAGLALAGVFVIAITPLLWVPVIIAAVLIAVRSGGTARLVRTCVALIVPVLFWAKSVPFFFSNPTRLILPPESMLTGTPNTWQMFLGRPFETGAPPLWISIVVFSALWIGAIIVGIRDAWGRWLTLMSAGIIAVGMWLAQIPLPLGITWVRMDPSAWLMAGFSLLVLLLATWLDDTLNSIEGKDFGGMQAMIAGISLLIIGAFILSTAWASVSGMKDVTRGHSVRVPAFLAQREVELDTGTLIISARDRSWNLRYDGQSLWGQGSLLTGALTAPEVVDMLEQVVARALEGRSDDTAADMLATVGVSAVVVLHPTQDTVIALDTTAGFHRQSTGGATEIWAVTVDAGVPTRRALLHAGQLPEYLDSHYEISAGQGTTLVLARPPDPNLRVYVGDTVLEETSSGDWRAAYTLGQASGEIRFEYSIRYIWLALVQIAVLGLLIIFAVPPLSDRSRDDEETPARMRRSR
ncbi:MAG: glycosyltransferase [Propionibacteriaceae bacterium]|nr:glycosyltransferase [Propionibacteriaceae bacterium]